MDKQLLRALDNLSNALELIATTLAEKGEEGQSSTTTALQSGDFVKTLEEINVGVKNIKIDTEKILKNQQTIIDLQKKKESDKKGGVVEESGGSKEQQNKIAQGVGIILLIAVAVLAIGLAFKIIGKVDFFSVIALSLAIVLIANAFAKVAELNITLVQAAIVSASMVMMALAITISSWIFSMITPISFLNLLTAIFIGGAFALIAPSIAKFIKGIEGVGIMTLVKAVIFLPLILPAIALGITLASWAFQFIEPISLTKAFTAILVAAVFAVVSFGIRKMLQAFDGISMKEAGVALLFLPLILPAIALGLALASYALQLIQPIGLTQFFSAVMVGLIFVVLSFGLKKMIKAFDGIKPDEAVTAAFIIPILYIGVSFAMWISSMALSQIQLITFGQFLTALGISILFIVISFAVSIILSMTGKLKWGDVVKLPVIFTLMSVAIALSAFILFQAKEYLDGLSFMLMLKIIFFSVALAISVVAIAVAMKLISMMGLSPVAAIKGGIVLVILAATIMVSSLILSLGNYKKYPSIMWALGVGASMAAFGAGALLLGSAVFGPQALVFLAGLAAILVVALTIVATSHILAMGNYKKYPSLLWSLGVSAALGAFTVGAILVGLNVLNPFFWAGFAMLPLIAESVVEIADILAKGKYDLPGLASWVASVALLYTLFTPLIIVLGAVGMAGAVVEFFGGANPFEKGRQMLKDIAYSIVDVAEILAKGNWVDGPTKEWSEGVAIALGAFAPVYQMLVTSAIFEALGGSGVGPKEFADAIETVAKGITVAALYFATNKSAFENGPSEKWAKGVGNAIGAFAPVFVALNENTGWFSSGEDVVKSMVMGIMAITRGIISAAEILAENQAPFETYPSKKWGKGVGEALNAFAPVFKQMNEDSGWFTSGEDVVNSMRYGITQIAYALTDAAWAFSEVTPEMWGAYPSSQWAKGVSSGVQGFMDLFDTMESRGYSASWFAVKTKILEQGVHSMASVARILWFNKKFFTVELDKDFIKNISLNVLGFAQLASELDKMLVVEKEVTTESGGIMGIGGSSETKTVRERKDLSLVRDVALQMAQTAAIFYKSRKFFTGTSYLRSFSADVVSTSSGIIMKFARLNKRLELYPELLALGAVGISPASIAAKSLVNMAKILYSGRKAFSLDIDPDYMNKVGKNMLDFNELVKKLVESESEGNSFFGKMGDSIASLFGEDPISKIANRMVTLAKGYDAMASALIKLGFAMKQLNVSSAKQLGGLTKSLAGKGGGDEEEKSSGGFSSMLSFGGNKPMTQVKQKGGPKLVGEDARKNSIGYVSEKLEELIKIMAKIERSTSVIDEGMEELTKGKIKPPPEISDFG